MSDQLGPGKKNKTNKKIQNIVWDTWHNILQHGESTAEATTLQTTGSAQLYFVWLSHQTPHLENCIYQACSAASLCVHLQSSLGILCRCVLTAVRPKSGRRTNEQTCDGRLSARVFQVCGEHSTLSVSFCEPEKKTIERWVYPYTWASLREKKNSRMCLNTSELATRPRYRHSIRTIHLWLCR